MTLKIEVLIPQDDVRAGAAGAYLEAALTGIGYVRLTAGEGNGLPAAESLPRAEVETDLPEQAKPAPAKPTKSKAKTEKAKAPEAAVPAISTGEERIDPETPETPEVAAQDAADEAAEAEATAKPELTHDDVRAELKKYLDKFGTPELRSLLNQSGLHGGRPEGLRPDVRRGRQQGQRNSGRSGQLAQGCRGRGRDAAEEPL